MVRSARSLLDRYGTPSAFVFVLYALVIAVLVPHSVIARNDDFGYLESTVLTIWNGWPTTSEWLEPNNALFSAVTAIAYRISGNFYLSTFGILIAFAIGNFLLLDAVLARWAPLTAASRRLLGFAIVVSPVYLEKSVSFIGVMPALFFELLALICYARRLYPGFFLSVLAGFLVRESAMMLLALPLGIVFWRIVEHDRGGRPPVWQLVLGVVATAAAGFTMKLSLNATWQQINIDYRALDALSLARLGRCLITGAVVSILSYMVFRLVLGVPATRRTLGERVAANPAGSAALAILAASSFLVTTPALRFDLPMPSSLNAWSSEAGVVVLLAFAALALGLRRGISLPWRSPLLAAAAGWIVLVSLHGKWWDYYFFEIELLALLLACESAGRGAPAAEPRPLARGPAAALGAVIAINALCGVYLAFKIARDVESIRIFERMTRAGELYPQQLAAAPFGFMGWKLYQPWLQANPGARFTNDAQFMEATDDADTFIRWRLTEAEAPLAECAILRAGEARLVGVRFHYFVYRCGETSSAIPRLDTTCRVLPLTEREWELAISGTPCSRAAQSRTEVLVGPTLEP